MLNFKLVLTVIFYHLAKKCTPKLFKKIDIGGLACLELSLALVWQLARGVRGRPAAPVPPAAQHVAALSAASAPAPATVLVPPHMLP